jgi:hypothetical protein
MANITQVEARKAVSAVQTLRNRLSTFREKATEMVGTVKQAAEVGVGSFGFGFARGYFGDIKIAGIPADMAAGAALHALAFAGLTGKYDEDLHNLANGAMSSYLTVLGAELGVKTLAQTQQGSPRISGEFTSGNPAHSVDNVIRHESTVVVPK